MSNAWEELIEHGNNQWPDDQESDALSSDTEAFDIFNKLVERIELGYGGKVVLENVLLNVHRIAEKCPPSQTPAQWSQEILDALKTILIRSFTPDEHTGT